MRILWGLLLWITKVWASFPSPPSAFVVICPSTRKRFNDAFHPGTDDFNIAAASHRPQARSTANNYVGALAFEIYSRRSQYAAPITRFTPLCMGGGQTHEKNGRPIGQHRKGDKDSPSVQIRQTKAKESVGIDFVRLVMMLAQSSRKQRSEQSTSIGRGLDENSRTDFKGAGQPPKEDGKNGDPRFAVTKPTSVRSGASRDEPVLSFPWRWLRTTWRQRGVVGETAWNNSTDVTDANLPIVASAPSAGRALASVQRSTVTQSITDADKISDGQKRKEGRLAIDNILSILKLGQLWSRERPLQPSLPPCVADEINPRETETENKEDELIFETILSMVKLGWPWSEQEKKDTVSPPVSIAAAQIQVDASRDGGEKIVGEQDCAKESRLTAMLPNFAWLWSQVTSDDEQRPEVNGREPPSPLSDSPSPSAVPVAPEKANKRWWSFLYWGRAEENRAEGRDSFLPPEALNFSRDLSDQQGRTNSMNGSEASESLSSSTILTPTDRERALGVEPLVNGPFVLPNRRRYYRIKVAVARPVSIIRNSLHRAAGVASVLPAVSSISGIVGALKPVASSTIIPIPPVSFLIGNTNEDIISFPVRVPWRPPGYRWGVSLISRRRSTSRRMLVESNTASEGLEQNLRDSGLTEAEELPSRSDAQMNRRSTIKSRLINKLRLKIEQARSGSAEDEKSGTDSVSKPNVDEDLAGVEVVKAMDGQRADPGFRTRGVPWWEAGAAFLFGVSTALYRPVVNRLPSISAKESPRDNFSIPEVQTLTKVEVDEGALPLETAVVRDTIMQPNVGKEVAKSGVAKLGVDGPAVRSKDTSALDGRVPEQEQAIAPAGSPRRPIQRGLTRAVFSRVRKTSRRAQLWALLRRRSMARAKPLLPEIETGISTLSVPLKSPEKLPSSAGAPALGLPQARVAEEADKLMSPTALGESRQNVSQTLGGSGWNLFAFFPKEKEDGDKNVGTVAATTNDSAPMEGSANSTDEEMQASTLPKSAWVQGLDPRAQIEAAMAQYLRSALGYGGSGLMEETNETLAAGDTAVLEVQKQVEGEAGSAMNATIIEGEKQTDVKSIGPTASYLDDLSPLSEEEMGAGWSGADAAAAAAGAAAGAAMDAAGVAAGVAADVAAAATAATLKVASPFGQAEVEEEEGWQVSGGRKKGKDKDDGEFGEGNLGVRPRKLDSRKAYDMVIDPVSTKSLRRSVASDNQIQRHLSPGARLLSAAMKRSRLPRRWKYSARGAESTPLMDVDMQEVTLRRLGRVGVTEIASSMLLIASETASQVDSVEELEQFREEGGMPRLLMALSPTPYTTKANGLAAILNLLRVSPESVAAEILETAGVEALFELRRLVGSPGEPWSSAAARAAAAASDSFDAMRLQGQAVQLLQELSLASDEVLSKVRELPNLIPALSAIAYPGSGPLGTLRDKIGRSLGGAGGGGRADAARRVEEAVSAQAVSGASKLLSMLGVHNWRPRQPGQKGLRILSLDGGGTRGVLTIALLKEVLKGLDKDIHEVFDVICGTSTGGILAMLFASEKQSLASASTMYDSLIVKIFRKDLLANAKLVLWQAQYSSTEWEGILEDILGDRRMIDTMNSPENPKVIVCSTIMNVNPLEMMLWRNYGYCPSQEPVYKGDYRRKIRECVRATTAAPSFFTPLTDGEMMYADGAFMANNPTSIAVTETKLMYPDVPIECLLSVGTGYYSPQPSKAGMSWNTVVNQLVNSATDTEGIDATLKTFLPPNQYFRFNPSIEQFDIDEIRPERLNELKALAKEYLEQPEVKARAEELRRVLRGESNSD